MEDRCVLCNKPLGSLVAATRPCPESIAGIALPCAAWRAEAEHAPQGEEPPLPNLWEAYHQSSPVPWRLLLRQPLCCGVFFAGVFAPPRGDLLLTWMVTHPLCACAWTTATMRTLSTDLPSPGQPGPRHVDTTPESLACVCRDPSRDRAICWGGVLPSPVVDNLRVPAPLASHTTVAHRLRVQSLPTFRGDGRPLHQRHAVSLACPHRMPDYVSVRCALHQQRLGTAQVPLERRAYLLAFSSPLSERKSDAVV